MKNRKTLKYLLITLTVIFCFTSVTGAIANNDSSKVKDIVSKDNTTSSYFKKGVYLNYALDDKNLSKDFFYIFYDEKSGHTDDGRVGMGLPFECKQINGGVQFSFGGVDPENEELLTIETVKNGIITGYFNEGEKLIFISVKNVNPDKFDAQKYLKKKSKILKKSKQTFCKNNI